MLSGPEKKPQNFTLLKIGEIDDVTERIKLIKQKHDIELKKVESVTTKYKVTVRDIGIYADDVDP